MQLPLEKNSVNVDQQGFLIEVYKVIKALNNRPEPYYLCEEKDRGNMPQVTVVNKKNGTSQQQNVRVIYRNTSTNSVNLDEIQRQNDEYVRNMSEQSRLNLEEFRKQSEESMKQFELSGQQGLEEFRRTNEAEQQKSIEEFKQKYGIQ
jgi:uncharacterized protein (UPF0333 family)